MKKLLKNTEWTVLIVSLLLFAIGAVALFSATQSTEYGEFKKQIQWFLISMPFLFLAYSIDYNVIARFSTVIYIIMVGLLIGVLFTKPINGATSWFQIGDVGIQPSELAKVVVVLFISFLISKLQVRGRKEINRFWKLLTTFIFMAIPIFLIIKQPDYGTAMAYVFAMVFILFISGIDKKYIIFTIVLMAVLVPVVYNKLPQHALKRIEVFLNPESDPRGDGYNIIQSKLAIGAGQLVGMGIFQGNQTQLGFLHPKTTDFIFSVIGEEFGFIATAAILVLYVVLITKIVYIAKTAKDNIGSYIAVGIGGIFFFHMLENIGMTIGLLPITGIPLPFVSYGGSSLVTNFICIGLLLNISSRRQKSYL